MEKHCQFCEDDNGMGIAFEASFQDYDRDNFKYTRKATVYVCRFCGKSTITNH